MTNEPGNDTPDWVPAWAPSKQTLEYVAEGLTAGALVFVVLYIGMHLIRGGRVGHGAAVAAGVGVGGAGT